tara:strand:+ start:25 stop:540 length:516 start_codon:yes stop_codon:yes gene_type:complete
MKNLPIILLTLASFNLHSQAHIGVMGAFDLENEYSKLGVGLNFMPLPKVMIGGGVMITPFDVDDDYEIMLNVKYNLGRFNVAAGYMFHEMPDDHMGMHMGMGSMNMGSMNSSDDNHNEPYIGIDYKLFKNKKVRIFFNTSESMKTLGLMMPIFNIGKKMHMNHNMDHSNHN